MELYQLRTFVTVAREGHQSRAAELLGLSQPAISGQIKALEKELEADLFEKTATGVVLTPTGQTLLAQAERVLSESERLKEIAKSCHAHVKGRLRLGTIIDPDYLRLGRILGSIVERHPLIQIETSHGISGQILERLRKRDVDAGFYLGSNSFPEIASYKLRDVTYRIVAPPHWREQIEAADWPDVAAMPWIGTPPHSSHTRITRELFASRGLTMSKIVVADQEASMISMVTAGLGLSLMRDDLAESAEGCGQLVIWRKAAADTPLSFAHIRTNARRADLEAVTNVVLETWGAC